MINTIFINGQEVNTKTSELLNERNILSTEGVVNIVIAYNKSMLHISLTTRGCFYAKDCPQLSYKLSYSIKTELTKIINDNTYDNITELENLLKDKAKDVCQQIIWKFKKKNPIIVCDTFNIDEIKIEVENKNFLTKSEVNNSMINVEETEEITPDPE